jgi:hypothetical protein
MSPSAPGYPPGGPHYHAPVSQREHESYEWYDSASLTLAATTAFQELIEFAGAVDSVMIQTNTTGLEFRFRYRGEPGGQPIRLLVTGFQSINVACEIVEVRDDTGAGGQIATAIGRYANRAIERRQHRMGPTYSPTTLPPSAEAYQIRHQ